MRTLDCRGQRCPQPVVQTRQLILTLPRQSLKVLVDDQVSCDNVTRLASRYGYQVEVIEQDELFQLNLTPGEPSQQDVGETPFDGPTIILVGSDQMGSGDAKLGQILLKNFIFTLTEGDAVPDAIYFVNGGVKLAVGGSDILEPLEKLACLGVDIASCGLCLEFFGLKDSLAVGRISNMLELVNSLHTAGRIIRP
ncbi:MAG: sulfurtransferase-like selenium metabolism protein YedF [Desulfuromonas sp.]|nr:MAG: sulfurtransferase-like selenium metabolism protein YedF [Desulfuromonas sp.]